MLIAEGSDVNCKGCSDLGDLEVRFHINSVIGKCEPSRIIDMAGLTKPGDLGDKVAFTALKSLQLGPKAKFQSPCYFETSPINFQ